MAHVPHIASRALEAAGAWYTAATATTLRGNWREHRGGQATITVVVTYTRGGSGGYPKLRFVWTHLPEASGGATRSGRDTTFNAAGTVSSGALVVDNYRTEVPLKGFSDLASVDTDDIVIVVPPDATALKVECAEVGNTGAPGTIIVDLDGEV
jgi:hypothetical protein